MSFNSFIFLKKILTDSQFLQFSLAFILEMGFGNKRENTNKDEFADGSNFESILKSPVHSAPETVVPTKKYRRHILHKDTNMDTDSMQSSDVNSDSNAKSSNTTSDVSSNSNTGHTNTSNSKKTNTGIIQSKNFFLKITLVILTKMTEKKNVYLKVKDGVDAEDVILWRKKTLQITKTN